MIKLAINATSVAPGGGLTVLAGFLEGWREINWGAKLTVYASRPEVLDLCKSVRPDIDVKNFALNAPSYKHFFMQQIVLGGIIAQDGADVVYSNQSAVGRCSIPQLVHHQNLKRFQFSKFRERLKRREYSESVKDLAARKAMRESACNVFISQYLRVEAERLCPNNQEKNHVVYNGVADQLINAVNDQESEWDGKPSLFSLQGTAEHKDTPTLIRVMSRLVEIDPTTNWKLSIAGEGNWNSCKKLASNLGVADRVDFLGFLSMEEIEVRLRNSCCLVFSSVLEGFGLPVIEAMARCCPPVACDCTAIPEVVGNAGILVPPGDDRAFAEAVMRVYHDPHIRSQLVEKGKAQIQQFSWSNASQKMAKIIESIAK